MALEVCDGNDLQLKIFELKEKVLKSTIENERLKNFRFTQAVKTAFERKNYARILRLTCDFADLEMECEPEFLKNFENLETMISDLNRKIHADVENFGNLIFSKLLNVSYDLPDESNYREFLKLFCTDLNTCVQRRKKRRFDDSDLSLIINLKQKNKKVFLKTFGNLTISNNQFSVNSEKILIGNRKIDTNPFKIYNKNSELETKINFSCPGVLTFLVFFLTEDGKDYGIPVILPFNSLKQATEFRISHKIFINLQSQKSIDLQSLLNWPAETNKEDFLKVFEVVQQLI